MTPTETSIIQDLRKLIRPGVHAVNLSGSALLDLPVVKQRTSKIVPGQLAQTFIETLDRVCAMRLQGKDRLVAPVVFGLGEYAGWALSERYKTAAETYHEHWSWESFRKEPLSRLLSAVAIALQREADIDDVPILVTPGNTRNGIVGHDWIMEHFDAVYRLPDPDGSTLEVLQTRRLRAIRNNVRHWRNNVTWHERGISGAGDVTLFGPGSARITESHSRGNTTTFVTEVTFSKAYQIGEIVQFTLLRHMPIDPGRFIRREGDDWFGLLKLPAAVSEAHIALQFGERRPQAVWRHEDIIDGLVRVGEPIPDEVIKLDQSGYAAATWRNLSPGMSYGLALRW